MPPYPWQRDVWAQFCEGVSAGRTPHAMLVTGVDGLGIEALAYSFSRYLLCLAPIEDVACGRCRGCELFQAETHPDFKLVGLEEKSKQIKVDQIRSCNTFVGKTAHFNHYKVVLIKDADTMNINAANALLKNLEEPSGQTVFLLVSAKLSAILPTIRSRCRTVTILPPPESEALSWLGEQKIQEADMWLQLAGGAPIRAKQWSEGDYATKRLEIYADIEGLLESHRSVTQVANAWQKMDLELLIDIQLSVLEAFLKHAIGAVVYDKAIESLVSSAAAFDSPLLFRLRDRLLASLSQWRESGNLNVLMLCEEMALDWAALSRVLFSSRARRTG